MFKDAHIRDLEEELRCRKNSDAVGAQINQAFSVFGTATSTQIATAIKDALKA